MAVYPDRIIYDGNDKTSIAVTNEWVLANKPCRVQLTSDKSQIISDDTGSDLATITVQLLTPLLIDGTQDNVDETIDVVIAIENNEISVSLVNGIGTIQVGAASPKIIDIIGVTYDANGILQIEAVEA